MRGRCVPSLAIHRYIIYTRILCLQLISQLDLITWRLFSRRAIYFRTVCNSGGLPSPASRVPYRATQLSNFHWIRAALAIPQGARESLNPAVQLQHFDSDECKIERPSRCPHQDDKHILANFAFCFLLPLIDCFADIMQLLRAEEMQCAGSLLCSCRYTVPLFFQLPVPNNVR